jgi:NAD(P)-dependent dehydrogenase (short-subunit alcohol dehydrogenase family)
MTMIDLKRSRRPTWAGPRAYLAMTEDTFVSSGHPAFQTGEPTTCPCCGVLCLATNRWWIDLDLWIMPIDLKSMVIAARRRAVHAEDRRGRHGAYLVDQCLRRRQTADAYQAAKAGMLALSKSLAIQFAGDKIRRTASPGPVDSPMQDRWREIRAEAVAGARPRPGGAPGHRRRTMFTVGQNQLHHLWNSSSMAA